jgi:hypothetical protein
MKKKIVGYFTFISCLILTTISIGIPYLFHPYVKGELCISMCSLTILGLISLIYIVLTKFGNYKIIESSFIKNRLIKTLGILVITSDFVGTLLWIYFLTKLSLDIIDEKIIIITFIILVCIILNISYVIYTKFGEYHLHKKMRS